jgi:hypothetical protein
MSFTDFDSQFGAGGDSLFNSAAGNQLTAATPEVSIWGEGGALGKGGAASMVLGGLETLGTLWGAFQQNKLAKKSLKFQKQAFKTNLANSTKVYNTALEDRIRARYATEGRSEQADAKIAENRL